MPQPLRNVEWDCKNVSYKLRHKPFANAAIFCDFEVQTPQVTWPVVEALEDLNEDGLG